MLKRFPIIPLVFLSLLFIPLIAMELTDQVSWTLFDFLIMSALLLSLGFGIELILRKNKSIQKRLVFIVLLILLFLATWAELAIGIFGTPFAGI